MNTPKAHKNLSREDALTQLQEVLNFIGAVAETLSDTAATEFMRSPGLLKVLQHFDGIEKKMADWASDPIPF